MKTILIILFFSLIAGQGFHNHIVSDYLDGSQILSTDSQEEHNGHDCPACMSSSGKTFLTTKKSEGNFDFIKFSSMSPDRILLKDNYLNNSLSSRAPPKA